MARDDHRQTERRSSAVYTFLITDIRGFTHFTNQLGDEAVGRLASKFAQITGEAVEAWGGQLLELRGDEALCVFESPRSALRCAVELQEAYHDETGLDPLLPMRAGIGLDAGEAVPVGDGFRGSALNLAARLCSVAKAGEVVVSDGIVHLAGRVNGLAFAALDAKSLKGFAEPVPAWQVSAARSHDHPGAILEPSSPTTLPPELDAIVPLAGRESDLRWLGWYWRRARHGHGGYVAISGPSGIGRTRIAAEIAAVAHGQGAAVRYLHADWAGDLPVGSSLVVIDDLDRVPAARLEAMFHRLASGVDQRLVVLIHGDDPPKLISRSLDRMVPPERRRRLRSIDADAVAAIARLYLERPGDDPPTQLLLEESEGIPAVVHRVASQWARATAARRLGESARRTSRERRDLRVAEGEMIDDAARLNLARERSRLYAEVDELATGDPASPTETICPYKGLAAFEFTDADYFFGRDRLIAELVARMVGSAFVGVIGGSGSGKSSVLHAGLLPALAGGVIPGSDQWIQVPMRPGEHPMRQLQSALGRALPATFDRDPDPRRTIDSALEQMAPVQRMLLVVDQFEEVVSSVADEIERATFVNFITEPRARLKVLIALRADHYERCAAYPRLARALAADQILVTSLTDAEIAGIVRHPAERVGLGVEPELVDALVADVGGEPGALPLLSTALLELWEARGDGRLTLAAYRASGGVRRAVARLAEAAWSRLDEQRQILARGLFLRLAGEGEPGSLVRRRVSLDELDVDQNTDMAVVLSELTASRLLTTSEGYVEVAHEALLREWPRLRGWVEDEGAGRQLRLHLMAAARAWAAGGREVGDLYRGARLASVIDWSAEHRAELNDVESTFIEESRIAAERETEQQRRTNRRLQALLAVGGVLLVLAVGAGAFAATQGMSAEEQRRLAVAEAARAEEQADLARSRELAQSAIAVLEQDPELSMQLAVEAVETGADLVPEAVTALHRAVQSSRAITHLDVPFADGEQQPEALGVELSADGSRLFVARNSHSIEIYDVASMQIVETLGTSEPDTATHILALAMTDDEDRIAIVDEDAVVHIWSLDGRAEQQIRAPGFGSAGPPSFSADDRLIAVTTYATHDRAPDQMLVTVWDLRTGQEIRRLEEDQLMDLGLLAVQVRFHPDGQRLLLAACDCLPEGGLRWLDVETGAVTESFVKDVPINAIAISRDGSLIATGDAERTVKLWEGETGRHIRTFRGHHDVILSVTFSPDGRRLASTAADGTIRIWDVESGGDLSGIEALVLTGQAGHAWGAFFSEDGSRLATGTNQMTVRIWDISRERAAEVTGLDLDWSRVLQLKAAGGVVTALGRACSAGFCFADVGILELDSGNLRVLDDVSGVGIGLTPDGSGLMAQVGEPGDDPAQRGPTTFGPIRRYSTATGGIEYELREICPYSFAGPAGDTACGAPPAVPWDEQIVSVAFSADGRLMALAGNSPAVSLWNARTGRLHGVVRMDWLVPGSYPGVGLALSRDGGLLALSTYGLGGQVVVLRTDAIIAADTAKLEELNAARGASDGLAEMAYLLGVVHRFDLEGLAIEFAPDGSTLAIGSPEGSRIYDLESGAERHALLPSWGLDISADGSRLITLDTDGFARLWDLASGRELQAVPAITEGVGDSEGAVQFADDERHIVVVDAGVVKVLTVDVEELLTIARDRFTRELTEEECTKYLHGLGCGSAPRAGAPDS